MSLLSNLSPTTKALMLLTTIGILTGIGILSQTNIGQKISQSISTTNENTDINQAGSPDGNLIVNCLMLRPQTCDSTPSVTTEFEFFGRFGSYFPKNQYTADVHTPNTDELSERTGLNSANIIFWAASNQGINPTVALVLLDAQTNLIKQPESSAAAELIGTPGTRTFYDNASDAMLELRQKFLSYQTMEELEQLPESYDSYTFNVTIPLPEKPTAATLALIDYMDSHVETAEELQAFITGSKNFTARYASLTGTNPATIVQAPQTPIEDDADTTTPAISP